MKTNVLNSLPRIFIIGMLFFITPNSCLAGAWTRKSGETYLQFTLNTYCADAHFDEDGNRRDFSSDGHFTDVNANTYMEYGLSDRLTVLTSLSYKYLQYEDEAIETKTYGFPDIDLGTKYKLSDTKMGIFSIQGMVKIPETYDEDDTLPLGNGQYDLEVRLLYGISLYPKIPGYVNLEAGYRWRLDTPSDECRYLAEFGLDFSPRIYGRLKIDGILSMENSDRSSDNGNTPNVKNESDLGKLDLAIGYKLPAGYAIELGVRPEIYGKNTSAGTNVSLAIAFKR
ncbi:MAG: hypothetical protein KJ737_01385 [Proteobacteria bacterium]|nr:hypothetical protein [Pseudomonadota bacterium]